MLGLGKRYDTWYMIFGISPHTSCIPKIWHMYVITYGNFMVIVKPWIISGFCCLWIFNFRKHASSYCFQTLCPFNPHHSFVSINAVLCNSSFSIQGLQRMATMVHMSSGFMQFSLPTYFTILLYYSDEKKISIKSSILQKYKESSEKNTFSKTIKKYWTVTIIYSIEL